jgi:hypothetical protein
MSANGHPWAPGTVVGVRGRDQGWQWHIVRYRGYQDNGPGTAVEHRYDVREVQPWNSKGSPAFNVFFSSLVYPLQEGGDPNVG